MISSHRKGNRGSETLRNLAKVTELEKGRIQTQTSSLSILTAPLQVQFAKQVVMAIPLDPNQLPGKVDRESALSNIQEN